MRLQLRLGLNSGVRFRFRARVWVKFRVKLEFLWWCITLSALGAFVFVRWRKQKCQKVSKNRLKIIRFGFVF